MNIGRVLKYTNLLDELTRKEAQKTTNKNTTPKTPAKKSLMETYREVARKKR